MNPTPTTQLMIQVAMRCEALPLIKHWNLGGSMPMDPHLSAEVWRGQPHGVSVALVTHGIDPSIGCDRIGTETATLVAFAGLRATGATHLINAGTCGGFRARGGNIGTVYMPTRFMFHDQRVAIPGLSEFARSDQCTGDFPRMRQAAQALNGICSTGSSLDATQSEFEFFDANEITCKDMEATAIARVCQDMSIPFAALKVVTDFVDHHESAAEAFLQNLATASAKMTHAVDQCVRQFAQDRRFG